MITNSGQYSDTFSLHVAGNAWETSAPASTKVLAPNASTEIPVVVAVPDEPLAARDIFTLTAVSNLEAAFTATATGETRVLMAAGVAVAPTSQAQVGAAGEVVTYTFTVTNTGNFADDFTLVVTSTCSTVLNVGQTINLQPDQSVKLVLTVSIPEAAQAGDVEIATLRITSGLDTAVGASAVAETTVGPSGYRVYLPLVMR